MSWVYRPGTPGTPGTPDKIEEVDAAGWSSGSVSIPITNGNGGYEFTVPVSVVGAVCGLASGYAGTGYRTINHALYFTRGAVVYLEFGAQLQSLGSHLSNDKFVMVQVGSTMILKRNGVIELVRPSTLGPVFRLASSLYLSGDTIVDAKVVAAQGASGFADTTIGPLRTVAIDGASSYAITDFGPMDAAGSQDSTAWADTTFGGMAAIASNKPYAMAATTIGPITSYGEEAGMAPAWAIGETETRGFMVSAHGFTGTVGQADTTFGGVAAIASNKPYASAETSFGGMYSFGAQAVDINFALLSIKGPYVINAVATESEKNGGLLMGPALTMTAHCGAQARLVGPRLTLDATATVPVMLRAELVGPSLTMRGSALVGSTMVAELSVQGTYGLVARTGAVADLTIDDRYRVDARALTGAVMGAALRLAGRYALDARATAGVVMRAELTGPALVATKTLQIALVGPALTMRASATVSTPASYEAYSINIATGAVTRYVDFAFDNVLRFGDRFFGIRADGIYELTGDTDDGVPIIANVRTFNTDFGKANLKRVPFLYVVGDTDTDLKVGFTADRGIEYKYPVGLVSTRGVQASRAKSGLGVKGTYYNFSLTNTEGKYFQIDRFEAVVDTTTVVKG